VVGIEGGALFGAKGLAVTPTDSLLILLLLVLVLALLPILLRLLVLTRGGKSAAGLAEATPDVLRLLAAAGPVVDIAGAAVRARAESGAG
jgi:hypothetical protein